MESSGEVTSKERKLIKKLLLKLDSKVTAGILIVCSKDCFGQMLWKSRKGDLFWCFNIWRCPLLDQWMTMGSPFCVNCISFNLQLTD